MSAPSKKRTWTDSSEKAGNILDYVINDTAKETIAEKNAQGSVRDELQAERLLSFQSNRVKSRVLFIAQDISLLEAGSESLSHFNEVSEMFDEVHIVVLKDSGRENSGTKRIGKRIWIYPVIVKHSLFLPQTITQFAKRQLEFTGGFRPDVVVALNPFEAGMAGAVLADKYDRPFQVHVMEDFTSRAFIEKHKKNKKRLQLVKYVLNRTQSVRASTEYLKEVLTKKFPKIEDVGLLPRHYNIKEIIETSHASASSSVFPQFSFVILFVGDLDHESTLFRVIDASRSALRSPKIGLVVLGDGPIKKEAQKRAEILGVAKQVFFESDMRNLIPFLQSADLLMCSDTSKRSDEIVMKAAAAGLPLLVAKTSVREDLFTDGESAFLCQPDDTVDFAQKLGKFLNTNSLRLQFSKNAQDIIKNRLHEDPQLYKISYRDSIEVVFGGEDIVREESTK